MGLTESKSEEERVVACDLERGEDETDACGVVVPRLEDEGRGVSRAAGRWRLRVYHVHSTHGGVRWHVLHCEELDTLSRAGWMRSR